MLERFSQNLTYESYIEQATSIIERKQKQILLELLEWEKAALERSEKCGCHHCKHEYVRAYDALNREIERQYGTDPNPDLSTFVEPQVPVISEPGSSDQTESDDESWKW